MIKLNTSHSSILVNTNSIVTITAASRQSQFNGIYSVVSISNGEKFNVRETVEQIYSIINESESKS